MEGMCCHLVGILVDSDAFSYGTFVRTVPWTDIGVSVLRESTKNARCLNRMKDDRKMIDDDDDD